MDRIKGAAIALALMGAAAVVLLPELARGLESANTATPAPAAPAVECVSIDYVMAVVGSVLADRGWVGVSLFGTDPETGDLLVTTIASGAPSNLVHRFRNGCFVEMWEEPL